MGKLSTPDWIKEGFDSPEAYAKSKGKTTKKKAGHSLIVQSGSSESQANGKTFKIKRCPKCGSNKVNVMLTGEEGRGTREWECKKCKWHGKDIEEKELTEDEFMKYLDDKEEPVA
jgi:DNA-directed RNA polymerase subunit M/transcription elongation factor TFIIS